MVKEEYSKTAYKDYLGSKIEKQGTKAEFRNWLSHKNLSLTEYSKLPIEEKKKLYREYQK